MTTTPSVIPGLRLELRPHLYNGEPYCYDVHNSERKVGEIWLDEGLLVPTWSVQCTDCDDVTNHHETARQALHALEIHRGWEDE